MAAKRGKSQARRNSGGGGGGGGMPGWAWLVLGVALTIGGVLLAPQLLNLGGGDGGFFRAQPTPNPDAKPAGGRDDEALAGEAPPPDAKPVPPPAPPKEQEYSFYNVLSGEETALSDEELAARAQAEASAPPPTPPAPKPPVEDVPKPLETTATPTPAPTPPQQAASATPDKDAGKQDDDARYILQAGAFAASGDAEALKAKIAFLGLSARVESAQLQGRTMYRVRMGPYGSASELAEAKRKLANGGLPALAIRSR